MDTRTLSPAFTVMTPPRTRRMHLRAVQKQSTQRKLMKKASDTAWPNRPCTTEEKAPVTQRKAHMIPKLRQQHLYMRDVEEERSQQSFDFVQTVCQTENSKKFKLVEMSGSLFDSTNTIAQFIRFQAAAGRAKQVRESFPTTYPDFVSKASKEKTTNNKLFRIGSFPT